MLENVLYSGNQKTFEEFEKTCLEKAKSSYIDNKLDVFPPRLFLFAITPKMCPVHGPGKFIVNLLGEEFVDMSDADRRAHMFEVGKTISEGEIYALHLAILMKVTLKGKDHDSLILAVGDSGTRWVTRFYIADLPADKKEGFEFRLANMKAKTYFNPLLAGLLSNAKEAYMTVIMVNFSIQWDARIKELQNASD